MKEGRESTCDKTWDHAASCNQTKCLLFRSILALTLIVAYLGFHKGLTSFSFPSLLAPRPHYTPSNAWALYFSSPLPNPFSSPLPACAQALSLHPPSQPFPVLKPNLFLIPSPTFQFPPSKADWGHLNEIDVSSPSWGLHEAGPQPPTMRQCAHLTCMKCTHTFVTNLSVYVHEMHLKTRKRDRRFVTYDVASL